MQQFSIEDIKEEIKNLKLEILEKEEIIEELLEIINDNKKEE